MTQNTNYSSHSTQITRDAMPVLAGKHSATCSFVLGATRNEQKTSDLVFWGWAGKGN